MKRDELPVHDIPALDGNNAPVLDESVFEDMQVIGEVPKDLNGLYVRNGPNAFYPPDWRYHAYDGDGMLHAVHFAHGRVISGQAGDYQIDGAKRLQTLNIGGSCATVVSFVVACDH